jgi:hypothetical protein
LTPSDYISVDAVCSKDVPFGGFNTKNSFGRVFNPKKLPHFWAGIGISSLNVESNNFRTALVICSSNDAARERNSAVGVKLKNCFRGDIRKTLQGSFPAKVLHSLTF